MKKKCVLFLGMWFFPMSDARGVTTDGETVEDRNVDEAWGHLIKAFIALAAAWYVGKIDQDFKNREL